MHEYIHTILLDLPETIRGFCKRNNDGSHTIVLNSRLSDDANRKTFQHEMHHITNDDLDSDEPVAVIEARARHF